MAQTKTVTVGGTSFTTLLAVAFIVLKLVGVIDWSWWWVLAPIWIPGLLILALLILWFIIAVFGETKR